MFKYSSKNIESSLTEFCFDSPVSARVIDVKQFTVQKDHMTKESESTESNAVDSHSEMYCPNGFDAL